MKRKNARRPTEPREPRLRASLIEVQRQVDCVARAFRSMEKCLDDLDEALIALIREMSRKR